MMGLLWNKTAIVYGAAGPVGAAVAGAFAREGARVVLTGRTPGTLAKVAEQIRDAGGEVETAVVCALAKAAVRSHPDDGAGTAGTQIPCQPTPNTHAQGRP